MDYEKGSEVLKGEEMKMKKEKEKIRKIEEWKPPLLLPPNPLSLHFTLSILVAAKDNLYSYFLVVVFFSFFSSFFFCFFFLSYLMVEILSLD